MRTLDRHIANAFNKPLLPGLLLFIFIIILPQLLEKIDTFLKHKVSFPIVLKYFAYQVPSILLQILPVSVLLATLFALGQLTKNNEITAMKTSGISIYRIISPILMLAFLISIFSIFFNESIVPYTNQKVKEIEKTQIYKSKPVRYVIRKDISFIDSQNRKYYIGLFDSKNAVLKDITVSEFKKDGSLKRIIYIKEAHWKNNTWQLSDVYTPKGKIEKEKTSLEGTPWDFSHKQKKSEEMNRKELKEYIYTLQKRGDPTKRELVELYHKISFPFTTLIITLIGIPLALQIGRASFFINFGISIAIAFIYWGMISLGKSLGKSGIFPPLVGAWFANFIFISIGIYLICKTKK